MMKHSHSGITDEGVRRHSESLDRFVSELAKAVAA